MSIENSDTPAPTPADERWQFKIKLEDSAFERLEKQRAALGFHSSNQLAAIYTHTFAEVPPEKVFEALAAVKKYAAAGPKKTGRIL